jgi:anti-sigma-K factor RskA
MSDRLSESCGDAAAYALGALDEREAAAFARHLETCIVCRDELEAFAAMTGRLALAAPQYAAPPHLRQAVLSEVRPPARRRPRARARARPAMAFAAGLAALALVLIGVGALAPSRQASRTVVAAVHGSGRAELRIAGGHGELIVRHFPAPPSGQIYEVWLVRRGVAEPQPTSALFGVTSAGDGVVEVPGSLASVAAVLVTTEPAGGSRVPTSPAVIDARLT